MDDLTVKTKSDYLIQFFAFSFILALILYWILSVRWLAGKFMEKETPTTAEYYEAIPFRRGLLEMYSRIQSWMGKQEISDFELYKDKQGNLHYISFYKTEDADVFSYAQRIARVKRYTQDAGTKVLFVMPPGKYDLAEHPGENYVWLNSPTEKIDELLMYLIRLGVDVLDLSDMKDAEFYKTDHHWTVQTAFNATVDLADAIFDKFGDSLDPSNFYLNLGFFDTIHLDENMLGSMGRKAGAPFSGVDDFEVLLPKFSSLYERTIISNNERRTIQGDLNHSLVNLQYLEEDDIYKRSSYSVYLDGIKTQNIILNQMARNNRTALIVHDSYFSPVVCFLAPMFREIHTVYNLEIGKSVNLEQILRENEYDYIIFEVYPFNVDDEAFRFFEEA